MLALLVASVLQQRSAPTDPLTAYATYIKAHPRLAVDMVMDARTKGALMIERPKRMRLDLRNSGLDYTYMRDGLKTIEISRLEKLYSPAQIGARLMDFESLLSDTADAYMPSTLLAGDMRIFLEGPPPKRSAVPAGTQLVQNLPDGSGNQTMVIAPDGRLLRYEVHSVGQSGRFDRVFAFSNYRVIPALKLSFEPPMGYRAYYLEPVTTPYESEQKLSLGTWRNASGEVIDLDSGPKKVVVVLDLGQGPSDRAYSHLPELAAKLGASTHLYGLAAKASNSGTVPVLASAPGSKRLLGAGAPVYYLVGSGVVQRVWMGDDEATRASMYEEIAEAAGK